MNRIDDDRPASVGGLRIRESVTQAGRYLGVGVVVTGVDYLVFLLFLQFGSGAAAANAFGRLLATGVGALLHRRYTFAGPQRLGWARQMVAYGALSAFNLGLSTAMIVAWVDHVGLGAVWAKVLTDLVVIALSILIGRLFIFAPAR